MSLQLLQEDHLSVSPLCISGVMEGIEDLLTRDYFLDGDDLLGATVRGFEHDAVRAFAEHLDDVEPLEDVVLEVFRACHFNSNGHGLTLKFGGRIRL